MGVAVPRLLLLEGQGSALWLEAYVSGELGALECVGAALSLKMHRGLRRGW